MPTRKNKPRVLGVPCSYCGARKGEKCRQGSGRVITTKEIHIIRRQEYEELLEQRKNEKMSRVQPKS